MCSHVQLRGRVAVEPSTGDDSSGVAAFVLENDQRDVAISGTPPAASLPWCEVVCRGQLALDAMAQLSAGDLVMVWGDLRITRPHGFEDSDLSVVRVEAEAVGRELSNESRYVFAPGALR